MSTPEISDTPALDSCPFPPATFLVVWLCSEDRLGRVGTLKWSSLATAVLILLMALSYGTTALFVPLSALTILAIGEYCIVVWFLTPRATCTVYRYDMLIALFVVIAFDTPRECPLKYSTF